MVDPLLRAIVSGRGPDTFPWGNKTPLGAGKHRYPEAEARKAQRDREAEANRIDRTPCPSCNVRADIHAKNGCRRVWP